jgi:integrase
LDANKLPDLLLANFRGSIVTHFFDSLRDHSELSPKTYNDYKGHFSSVFNYLVDQKDVPIGNPILKVKNLSVEDSEQYEPFSNEQLDLIKKYLQVQNDKQMYLFISFIYYTFVRPGQELRLMKVKHIGKDQLFIPASTAKANKGDYVTIPEGLEELLTRYKIRKYSPEFYLFTASGEPGPEPAGKNFFIKRHRKMLEALGLADSVYSMYGYKHTGALDLYDQTKDIIAVQRHCRHSSVTQTETYLRRYGKILNEKAYQLPKKF